MFYKPANFHFKVQLCVGLYQWLLKLVSNITKLGYKILLKPGRREVTKEATRPISVPSIHKHKRQTSSVFSRSEDAVLTETMTSAGLTSREATPIRDMNFEDKSPGVKLSLWVQWTLPKLETRFYRNNEHKKGL